MGQRRLISSFVSKAHIFERDRVIDRLLRSDGAFIVGAVRTSSTRFTASVADYSASDMNITRVMAVGITAEKMA